MHSKTALFGSAALAMLMLASSAGAASAATKHRHHIKAEGAPTSTDVKALTEEVQVLESRLTAP